MGDFSTRVGQQPTSLPITNSPVKKTEKPPVPPKPSSLSKPRQDKQPVSLTSSESSSQIQQRIEQTPPQTLQQNAKKTPPISGLPQQTPDIHPQETLVGEIVSENQAKSNDGHFVTIEKQAKKMSSEPSSDPPPPNQVSGMVMLGGGPDSLSVRGRMSVANLGDSGMTLALSGGIAITNTDKYTDNNTRVLQVRSKQAELNVGLSGPVGDTVPVSGSVGVAGGFDVAYARNLKPNERLAQARQTDPPSRGQIAKNPTASLNPGDEIAFRGFLSLGVSVGAIEPNSGVKFSVGVDVRNEFITSIKRSESDPPSFRLHIEPSNRNIDGKASVGWGPFAVTGGVGYASTVYYEFDMTPEALSQFLDKGTLPELPDPSKYLRPGVVLSDKTFAPFQNQSQDSGVSIVGFGATKSLKTSLELSATVGKVSTSSEKMRAVYVRDGEVLREDVHTMVAGRSAWFKGELSNTLGLKQSNRYTAVEGHKELVPRYAGLEASFQIADTKTSNEDLGKRLENTNQLLGRVSSNGLSLPPRSDSSWGKTSLVVKANLTPEVIDRLASLDPDQGDAKFQIEFMAREHKVPASDVREMLSDLRKLASGPDKDAVRREQGLRIAGFLASGYTSVVNDEELKRIAVLDRLAGGKVATVEVASSIHTDRLNSLAVDGFLSSTRGQQLGEFARSGGFGGSELQDLKARLTQESWDRFNVGAQKLNALETLREDIVSDTLLDPDEKTGLLRAVDEQRNDLGELLGQQLENPEGRARVMSGLLQSGSVLPSAIYTSPEKMFDDPLVKGVFLDQVVGAAFLHGASPEELAGLLTQISQKGKGPTGIDQAFKILSLAETSGVQKQVLDAMDPEDIADFFPRMSPEQQSAMLTTLLEVTKVDKGRMDNMMSLIEKSRERADKQFDKFKSDLSDLDATLFELDTALPKDKHLMEHFKAVYKEVDRPLQKLQTQLEERRGVLGEIKHSVLQGQTQELENQLGRFFDQMSTLTPPQRQDLFKQLLRQDNIGEASQFMLRHMIGSSPDESELIAFAGEIKSRSNKLESATILPHQASNAKAKKQVLKECMLEVQLRLG